MIISLWCIIKVIHHSLYGVQHLYTACYFLHVEIAIGFYTDSSFLISSEANGTVTLSIRVLNGTIGEGITIQVRFTTADNSAHGREQCIPESRFSINVFAAPSDYTPTLKVLTFSSSSTTQTVHVSIVNDSLLEINEGFTASLLLDDPADLDYVQLGPTSASITIIDDDGNVHAVISL